MRNKKSLKNKGNIQTYHLGSVELTKTAVIIIIGVIAFLGFLIRVASLDVLSLWVDEYVHVNRAQDVIKGTGPLFTSDNNGILLTIFLLPLFSLFSDSAFWARIPSVLFGTGLIVMVYHLGKRLFNQYVGILSAFILSFSLYFVYWSKLCRNYMIFAFFYSLMLFFFLKAFENRKEPIHQNVINFGIDWKYFILFAGAFLLSLLSHQLTFMFLFGIALYFIISEIVLLFTPRISNYKNNYFLFSILSFLFLFFILSPVVSVYVKSFLGLFLPENNVNWIIPDWGHLSEYYKKNPFKIFNLYADVLKYDLKWVYIVGILGLPISFLINKKSGIFLVSLFLFPFLLMSFVFYDPALPRYIIFIYPLFIISVSVFFYKVIQLLADKILKPRKKQWIWLLWVVPFVVVASAFRTNELKSLSKAEKTLGFVVDKRLSQWSFTNWNFPCKYVESLKKPGDIILSTVPQATNYYLKTDSSVLFRQRHFDSETKKFVKNESDFSVLPDARTLENLQKTIEQYERGWLLADYYFYNVMTDQAAMTFVCKHMDYHPEATNDGGVLVFSWSTRNPPEKKYQSTLFVLGKSDIRKATNKLNINLKEEYLKASEVRLMVNAQFVSENEMIVNLNDKYRVFAPPCKTQKIETLEIKIPKEQIKAGINTIQIHYNDKVKIDHNKGFSVHQIAMSYK